MAKSLKRLIIAIDGPAGSGKSTVSKMVAKKLGLLYMDTGAMYRALTLKAMRKGLNMEDGQALAELARSTAIDLKERDGKLAVFLDGEEVSSLIRTPELTGNVKYIARVPGVRAEMVRLQRAIGDISGAVLEGRDIGTVVFPDAEYKFYLDADVEERARRRHKELVESGQKINLDAIRKDVITRDESDKSRDVGALRIAKGAIVVDTTDLTIEETAGKLMSYIRMTFLMSKRRSGEKMRVKLSKKTGFCFGVKRAVAMAEAAIEKHKNICSLGSIIHNAQVVRDLSKRGLKVVSDIDGIKGRALVISSHGISPKIARKIKKRGIKIIDTTCPFVLKAQRIAKSLGEKGDTVIIVGDRRHPEVKALVDFVPRDIFVVKDRAEAKGLRLGMRPRRISVISQTTQSPANFLDVVHTLRKIHPGALEIFNTICADAADRQDLARRLAKEVDVMLVVGGRDSANTRRLFEVCEKTLKNSYLVETERDIRREWFKKCGVVGITSGASTPDWVIKNVINKIKKF